MKLFKSLKAIAIVCLPALIIASCSKDNDDEGGGGTPELAGYWKGNTTPPGNFTNPLNGLNLSMKAGNKVRVYYSTVQRPLNDTSASDVIKEDGTYSVNGDFVDIVTARINCQGTKNAAFTNMQGTFIYSDFGITLTQNFIVKK